jgi:hypothetical protein
MFQSGKGDCLLLETDDGRHRMLVDGGVRQSYVTHVAPVLGELRAEGKHIDVAYISHIDDDHIAGVLQLLDDEAAWRVHEHQLRHANPSHRPPASPRPAQVGTIYHNSFHDQIGKNSTAIGSMLAATASILSASDDPWLARVAADRRDLAHSVPQALRVSQRIKPNQLDIKLNPPFDGRLMMVDDDVDTIALGTVTLKVLGPFATDLRTLRKEWNNWLRGNRTVVKSIRERASVERRLMTSDLDLALAPLQSAASQLGAIELADAQKLGNRNKVTAPNLASLMFLAEEAGQTVLLTGDGHANDIIRGLDHHHALDSHGKLHVSVLKVQHHGSEHNIDRNFCDTISADNYLFCGNGEHSNPEIEVIKLIHDRRMANDNRPFAFWFSSSSSIESNPARQDHMGRVEALVAKLTQQSQGRLTYHFNCGSSMRIQLAP